MTSESRIGRSDSLGLVSFGLLLILVGVIFMNIPNIIGEIRNFFNDFDIVEVSPNCFLPAPGTNHPVLYTAVAEFSFAFGLFQIVLLTLRFLLKDTLGRKAETLSSIVFWLGVGFGFNMLATIQMGWFALVSWFIMIVGVSITIRSVIVLWFRRRSKL